MVAAGWTSTWFATKVKLWASNGLKLVQMNGRDTGGGVSPWTAMLILGWKDEAPGSRLKISWVGLGHVYSRLDLAFDIRSKPNLMDNQVKTS